MDIEDAVQKLEQCVQDAVKSGNYTSGQQKKLLMNLDHLKQTVLEKEPVVCSFCLVDKSKSLVLSAESALICRECINRYESPNADCWIRCCNDQQTCVFCGGDESNLLSMETSAIATCTECLQTCAMILAEREAVQ